MSVTEDGRARALRHLGTSAPLPDYLAERLEPVDLPHHHHPPAELRPAAVLVLLMASPEGWTIPLIRRSETQRRHPGQVVLPGGLVESGDESLAATAKRETWEEIGVRVDAVTLLGRLPSVVVSVSGFEVHPFVGYAPKPVNLVPHDQEVAEILMLPLVLLLDPDGLQEQPAPPGARHATTFALELSGHTVWGATARIVASLAAVLRRIEAELDA